jgi:hypothetical protein
MPTIFWMVAVVMSTFQHYAAPSDTGHLLVPNDTR